MSLRLHQSNALTPDFDQRAKDARKQGQLKDGSFLAVKAIAGRSSSQSKETAASAAVLSAWGHLSAFIAQVCI